MTSGMVWGLVAFVMLVAMGALWSVIVQYYQKLTISTRIGLWLSAIAISIMAGFSFAYYGYLQREVGYDRGYEDGMIDTYNSIHLPTEEF